MLFFPFLRDIFFTEFVNTFSSYDRFYDILQLITSSFEE